jgi:hypothetical protein
MMDKLFDLRDKGFREYFFKSSHNAEWLNSIMDKEEINNKDLIRFYLEYSKLCDNYPLLIVSETGPCYYRHGNFKKKDEIRCECIDSILK